MKTKFIVSAWRHAILHAALLVEINHKIFCIFAFFCCAVYVPIAPPQRTKMAPQHRLEIYIGFDFPSTIRYLKTLTGDIFKALFESF
jgi:hypothetical protein